MRFLAFLFVFLLSVPCSFGQLTIKPSFHSDSYLYVNGDLVFVSQDVNLEKNAEGSSTEASIYLRGEAQLIQGEGGNGLNTGDGVLSVFQEGTSNAFDYNYWASPVSNGLAGNGSFGIQMLYSPKSRTESVKALNSMSLDGISSPLTISSRWIFTYSGVSYSDWKPVMAGTTIPAGAGFTMKGVNGEDHTLVDGVKNNPGNSQRYDFRGKPNNGPISIPVFSGEYTLVGNPFPSALDLSLFLLENSGTGSLTTSCGETISRNPVSTGIAYFWDSVENGNSHYLQDYIGGYGAFSPVDPCTMGIYERPVFKKLISETGEEKGLGNHYDRRFSPIAQGFMVQAAENSNLLFTNNHRVFRKEGDFSEFKQPEVQKQNTLKTVPKIRLEAVINNKYSRQFTMAFWPTSTSKIDSGMDAAAYNIAPTDIGIFHEDQSYIIDVRPFSETEAIPMYLKVDDTQASLELKISLIENLQVEQVYILDTYYNICFPLFDHTFRIILDKGVYHERFKITFQDIGRFAPKDKNLSQDIIIFQNMKNDRLEILNRTRIPLESIEIFDLSGKQLFSATDPLGEKFYISTSAFADSYYIVRVKSKDRRMVSKQIKILNLR